MQDLNRKNTETVEQALKDMYNKIQAQQIRIDALNNAVSSLNEKINALEKIILMQKVLSTGLGPSAK